MGSENARERVWGKMQYLQKHLKMKKDFEGGLPTSEALLDSFCWTTKNKFKNVNKKDASVPNIEQSEMFDGSMTQE
jgi:hypothetical protein